MSRDPQCTHFYFVYYGPPSLRGALRSLLKEQDIQTDRSGLRFAEIITMRKVRRLQIARLFAAWNTKADHGERRIAVSTLNAEPLEISDANIIASRIMCCKRTGARRDVPIVDYMQLFKSPEGTGLRAERVTPDADADLTSEELSHRRELSELSQQLNNEKQTRAFWKEQSDFWKEQSGFWKNNYNETKSEMVELRATRSQTQTLQADLESAHERVDFFRETAHRWQARCMQQASILTQLREQAR